MLLFGNWTPHDPTTKSRCQLVWDGWSARAHPNTAPLRRGTKKRNRKNILGVGRFLSNPLCDAGRAVGVSAPRTEGARARSERHEIDEYEEARLEAEVSKEKPPSPSRREPWPGWRISST